MTAISAKKIDFKRWVTLHKLAMSLLGYAKNDVTCFYQVAYFIAIWVDKTGRLPKSRDFIACKKSIEKCPTEY